MRRRSRIADLLIIIDRGLWAVPDVVAHELNGKVWTNILIDFLENCEQCAVPSLSTLPE